MAVADGVEWKAEARIPGVEDIVAIIKYSGCPPCRRLGIEPADLIESELQLGHG